MKHTKKLTKILFLFSLSSFVITLILEFSQRYNQILFILRHSTLYLGIAFLISAVVSIFYYIYKSYFIKRQINLVFLNITTLVVMSISLIWIADTRLDFIAENEVPQYMNEILYDDYSNKIYESILVGIAPSIEVIEKTDNKLVLHIEESCVCQQHSYYIEDYFPDDNLDSYINGKVDTFSDIEIVYNDDHSINTYTIRETRNISFEPENLQPYFGYISRKLEITNEYNPIGMIVTQNDYYYTDMMNVTEFQTFSPEEHYAFTVAQASTSYYRLYKSIDDDNEEFYIMENQVQGEDVDEMAILHRSETEVDGMLINFEESENRLEGDGSIISFGPTKSNLIGSVLIGNDYYQYSQAYDQTNVEAGVGYTEILRTYDFNDNKYTLTRNDITFDSISYGVNMLNNYKGLFSSTSYVEMVSRGGTVFEDISRLENPFEIDNIKLYQIEHQEFGHSVSYYMDASPFNPYNPHENSNMFFLPEFAPPITGYFDYYTMLFQNSYTPTIVYENNEMINFIAGE